MANITSLNGHDECYMLLSPVLQGSNVVSSNKCYKDWMSLVILKALSPCSIQMSDCLCILEVGTSSVSRKLMMFTQTVGIVDVAAGSEK